jgi:hypothetical protein
LSELFNARGETIHQRLHLLKPLLGFRLLRAGKRGVEFPGLGRLQTLQVGNPLVDICCRLGEPDIERGNLHLPQLDLPGKGSVDHPLGPRDADAGRLDLRFGHHLVGHHADRQQNADGAGEAELVSDAVELDHFWPPMPQAKSVVLSLRPRPGFLGRRLTCRTAKFG